MSSSSDRTKEKQYLQKEFKNRESDLIQNQRTRDESKSGNANTDIFGGGGGGGGDILGDSGNVSTSSNSYSNQPPLPFNDDNQNIYLINIAHRHQRPKYKAPAFRICGGFRDVDKLKKHVSRVGESSYGGANLHATPAHKKFLLCTSMQKQTNPNYVLKKIEEISGKHTDMIDFHNREFEKNKENHKMGQTGLSNRERISKKGKLTSRKKVLDKMYNDEISKGEEVGEISAAGEVRNQRVAVVSVINDLTPPVLAGMEDPEPVIIIWGCFENEDKAKHYIFNTAQERVKDVMLDIYNMYEWVYPTEMDIEQVEEQYRNPTLNKVMKARKTQKTAVMNFEEWCKREGKELPALEIDVKDDGKTEIKQTASEMPAEMKVSVRDNRNDDKSVEEKGNQAKSDYISTKLEEFKEVGGQLKNNKFHEYTFRERKDEKCNQGDQSSQEEEKKH